MTASLKYDTVKKGKLNLNVYNFIKKKTQAQVFSCKFCEIFMNTFVTEHLRTTASIFYFMIGNILHYFFVLLLLFF